MKHLPNNAKPILLPFFFCLLSFVLFSCSEPNNPPDPPDNEPDTTSHDFNWVVDTLYAADAMQILMTGIWGTDENNVYAVGHSDDTDYQIWHWDGVEWKNINPHIIGDRPSYSSIYGFAQDDIWIAGNGAWINPNGGGLLFRDYILHYDGSAWNRYSEIKTTPVRSVWGNTPDNVYFGCDSGVILHHNGTEWRKNYVGNNAQIQDIYSIDDEEIFAAGALFLEPRIKIFQFIYQNNNWAVVDSFWSISSANEQTFGIFKWGSDINNFYSAGNEWLYKYNGKTWDKIFNSVLFYDVYGSGPNNVFAVSIWNNVFHYNGNTWKRDEFFEKYNLDQGIKIWCNNNNVFITGQDGYSTKVYRGVKKVKGGD